MKEITDIHIGRHIKEVVAQKGIKVPWIAQQLGCHRNNVYLIFSRQWIDTGTLMKLSIILQYNFFAELSEWFQDGGFTNMVLSGTTPTTPHNLAGFRCQ